MGALVAKAKKTPEQAKMKRISNIYDSICSLENLRAADDRAQIGKGRQLGVIRHNRHREANILRLHETLAAGNYRTSPYTTFKVHEPKEREIFRLPYYPDRIVHHAIVRQLEAYWVRSFTADTYCCIKGRGIHAAARAVKRALLDREATQYCLKLDVRKFYPSIDHDILKAILRRRIKDRALLGLLDEIIDSTAGVPIGNLLSQYFANIYLSGFDHWIKEECKVRHYFRYCDDIVILGADKASLHQLRMDIKDYLATQLKLTMKSSYQVFPVATRGIDFVGYRFFHGYTLLRKSIKQRFARMLVSNRNPESIASYNGWLVHADCRHLEKKLLSY